MKNDLYETLDVSSKADAAEIKRAYRRLARKLHPDINKARNAARRMSEVNEAYWTLSDAERRAAYDAGHRKGIAESPAPPSEAAGSPVVSRQSSVDLPSPAYSLAFSPDGRELVIGMFNNTALFVAPTTGRMVAEAQLHGGAVSTLQYVTPPPLREGRVRGISAVASRQSPVRTCLVAAGLSEKTVSIWRLERRLITSRPSPSKGEGRVGVNNSAYEVVKSRSKRAEWVSQIAISPDGTCVALGSVHRTLMCMSTSSGKTLYQRRRHEDSITALTYSSDGRLLASGGNDQRVVLYDAATGRETLIIGPLRTAVAELAFSQDTSLLAVALIDHGVRIFELKTGKQRAALWGHDAPIEGMAFHRRGRLLATVSRDATTRLWSSSGGSERAKLGGHTRPLKAVCFSRDGSLLAAAGLDRVVSIWSVKEGAKP